MISFNSSMKGNIFMLMKCKFEPPFKIDEIQGYISWEHSLSELIITTHFYHCCHANDLKILDSWTLTPRSDISFLNRQNVLCKINCLWCSLNRYDNNAAGSYYGPFMFEFPVDILEGRNFIFIHRGKNRRMIEYTKTPSSLTKLRPQDIFHQKEDGNLGSQSRISRYDIVLTTELSLDCCTRICIVNHVKDHCISNNECKETDMKLNTQWLKEEIDKRLHLHCNNEYKIKALFQQLFAV